MRMSVLKLQKMPGDQNEAGEKHVTKLRHDLLKKLESRQEEEMEANEKTRELRSRRLALLANQQEKDSASPKTKAAPRRKKSRDSAKVSAV